jgi:phosphinothricin acetyltransferase
MAKGAAFLAEAEAAPVACIFAEVRPDRVYIGRLAVDQACRGAGLGAAMLAEVERFARTQGVPCLELGVRLVLADNISLFQKVGFKIVGQRSHPGFNVPTYHVMEKRLD